MNIGNRNTGRENFFMRKRLRIAVFIVFFIGIVLIAFRYFKFVSKTVYEESASHLTEVFHPILHIESIRELHLFPSILAFVLVSAELK